MNTAIRHNWRRRVAERIIGKDALVTVLVAYPVGKFIEHKRSALPPAGAVLGKTMFVFGSDYLTHLALIVAVGDEAVANYTVNRDQINALFTPQSTPFLRGCLSYGYDHIQPLKIIEPERKDLLVSVLNYTCRWFAVGISTSGRGSFGAQASFTDLAKRGSRIPGDSHTRYNGAPLQLYVGFAKLYLYLFPNGDGMDG